MIIIIGAGLSGLSLARYLQGHQVEFRIFDQSDAQREQGYGLSLRRMAYGPLLPLLEISEVDFRQAVAVDRKDGIVDSDFVDFVTGEVALAAPYPSDGIRSNRQRLRQIIQGKINVEFNHKLIRIAEDSGGVVATFANGVQVSGNLLVAADGVHSFIRRTLIPQVAPIPQKSEGVWYNGIRKMSTQEFEQKLRPTFGNYVARFGFDSATGRIIVVTIYDWDTDKDIVSISWAYSRRRTGLHDPLFTPYTAAYKTREIPLQLWQEIASLQHPLIEPFRTIFSDPDVDKDEVLRQLLVCFVVPRDDLSSTLGKDKVVFIGDSAHAWSNHAGTGGNNAILDGLELGRVLVEGESVENYYDVRHPQWENSIVSNVRTFNELYKTSAEWQELVKAQKERISSRVQK